MKVAVMTADLGSMIDILLHSLIRLVPVLDQIVRRCNVTRMINATTVGGIESAQVYQWPAKGLFRNLALTRGNEQLTISMTRCELNNPHRYSNDVTLIAGVQGGA